MQESVAPKLAKWPFIVGDTLLLVVALAIASKGGMGLGETALVFLCVLAGALLSIVPFWREYSVSMKVFETRNLTSVVEQIQNLDRLGVQIAEATAQWQTVHEHAGRTTAAAKEITERMSTEVKGFEDFMEHINDNEKSTLRLEVDKLRRGEAEWLQVTVRLLDHIHALYRGAVRGGDSHLIDQIGRFQHDCVDAARRVGVTPYLGKPGEPFDAKVHQLLEKEAQPADNALIAETLALGLTYQGRLLRPALVRLQQPQPTAAPTEAPVAAPAEATGANAPTAESSETPPPTTEATLPGSQPTAPSETATENGTQASLI